MLPLEIRKNLIVSADDFGLNRLVNQNILTLARQKKIDRVSIMINGQLEAAEIFELKTLDAKLDLHLCSPERIREKSRPNEGVAKRMSVFLAKLFLGKIKSSRVEAAWLDQLKKFQETFGRLPDGLNSHQYLHFFTPYLKIIISLAKKFKIPYIRLSSKGVLKYPNNVSGILRILWYTDKPKIKNLNVDTSDFMVSLGWIPDFNNFLKNLPRGRTELVCHPEKESEFKILME